MLPIATGLTALERGKSAYPEPGKADHFSLKPIPLTKPNGTPPAGHGAHANSLIIRWFYRAGAGLPAAAGRHE